MVVAMELYSVAILERLCRFSHLNDLNICASELDVERF